MTFLLDQRISSSLVNSHLARLRGTHCEIESVLRLDTCCNLSFSLTREILTFEQVGELTALLILSETHGEHKRLDVVDQALVCQVNERLFETQVGDRNLDRDDLTVIFALRILSAFSRNVSNWRKVTE